MGKIEKFLVFAFLVVLGACTKNQPAQLKSGIWRGVVNIQGQELPFNFTIENNPSGYQVKLRNAEEQLVLDEIKFENDSVVFVMHIFDSELRAKIDGDSLKGYFIKNYETNYRLPFAAAAGQDFRFDHADKNPTVDYSGKYAVVFTNETEITEAIGIFKQTGNVITGTFLTPTGDYRYLEGNIVNNQLNLSTIDGNHTYLFTANKISETQLSGMYFSGKTWSQRWEATKDDKAKLPDPETMNYLKPGYETIHFSFPDLDQKMISPQDDRFKNKVLILQLFGTWCPNCMDETKFLAKWYIKNKDRGVEILGLAYEAKDDFAYASGRIEKMKKKLDVSYPFVIAGNKDKEKASKTLPMINKVLAFPTTIFIGKDGKVKKIHTGFSGPGTFSYYDQFVQRFNETVNELLREEIKTAP